jgi:hypothetical protein
MVFLARSMVFPAPECWALLQASKNYHRAWFFSSGDGFSNSGTLRFARIERKTAAAHQNSGTCQMTKVQAIEEEIKNLSPSELAELRDWLLEHDWAEWNRQIERDSSGGKLEKLFAKARVDHDAGKSTKR